MKNLVRASVTTLSILAACGGGAANTESRGASSDTSTSDTTPTSGSETSTSSTTASSGTSAGSASATGTTADPSGPSADLADYARRTMAIVRRHWMIPAAIGPEQAAGLSSSISILIDETTRRATGYRVLSLSGNTIFDESVHHGLQALVDANELMPEPPVGLDDRASVRLRLVGR